MNNQQVDKNAYNFSRYVDQDRWSSYWHQIKELTELEPASVLEIGVGDKVLANYIKTNTAIKYSSMDIAPDLSPDYIGSADNLSFDSNSFDVICAFEVLEHLPYEKFSVCLQEMLRVSKNYAVISLPHWGRHFSIDVRLPFFKRFKFKFKLSLFSPKHRFSGQHYWEVGKFGFPLLKIKKQIIDSGWEIKKDYIAFNSPYHRFFILQKKN
jgi:hypothetical protein